MIKRFIILDSLSFFLFTEAVIKKIKQKNIKLFSFTNQPGIAEGRATEMDFINELKTFGFDDMYLCPHSASEKCGCRKPQPGMLLTAAKDHKLDLAKCVVIGDRWSDITAASYAGCLNILVKTGAGEAALNENRYLWEEIDLDYVAKDSNEAVD